MVYLVIFMMIYIVPRTYVYEFFRGVLVRYLSVHGLDNGYT